MTATAGLVLLGRAAASFITEAGGGIRDLEIMSTCQKITIKQCSDLVPVLLYRI